MICECLGGSHMYELNGPQSDLDHRGIFVSQDPDYILGLGCDNRDGKFVDKKDGQDLFLYELRHFLRSLRKTNTQAIELLYNTKWTFIDPIFQEIQKNKEKLMDSNYLFRSLMGYIQGEFRLMTGERTGELGSKRKLNLEKYGYSYKNAVQYLRLCYSGAYFFQEGVFPVSSKVLGEYELLKDIKNNPERYTLDQVKRMTQEGEEDLVASYEKRNVNFNFEPEVANKILIAAYKPYI